MGAPKQRSTSRTGRESARSMTSPAPVQEPLAPEQAQSAPKQTRFARAIKFLRDNVAMLCIGSGFVWLVHAYFSEATQPQKSKTRSWFFSGRRRLADETTTEVGENSSLEKGGSF